jgi:hypothetical protein
MSILAHAIVGNTSLRAPVVSFIEDTLPIILVIRAIRPSSITRDHISLCPPVLLKKSTHIAHNSSIATLFNVRSNFLSFI